MSAEQKNERPFYCMFYGSLRVGMYNYQSFKHFNKDGFSYIPDQDQQPISVKIPGYELFSLGSYPTVIKGGDGHVVMELFKLDRNAFTSVDRMEIGAGYSRAGFTLAELKRMNPDVDALNALDVADDAVFYFYEFTDREVPRERLVESGDWVKHVQSRNQI